MSPITIINGNATMASPNIINPTVTSGKQIRQTASSKGPAPSRNINLNKLMNTMMKSMNPINDSIRCTPHSKLIRSLIILIVDCIPVAADPMNHSQN